MSIAVPTNVWRPTDGLGEMGQSDDANITTLSGLNLVTLSDLEIIIDEGEFTQLASSEWVEDNLL